MNSWLGLSRVGLLGLVLLSACGKSSRGLPDDTGGAAGMPGEIDGDGEPKPDDEAKPKPIDVPGEVVPDVMAEIELIAGTSFNVTQSPLTPSAEDSCCGYIEDVSPFIGAGTYHFEKNAEGGLDVVVSILGPWLHVERAKLERVKHGWRAKAPLVTGVRLAQDFEEEVGLALETPTRLTFSFDGIESGNAPTELTVDAVFEEASSEGFEETTVVTALIGEGVPDTVAPRLIRAPQLRPYVDDQDPHPVTTTYIEDHRFSWDAQSFVFSEALRPGWSVTVQDEQGNTVESVDGKDDATGLELDRYYPPRYRLVLQGQDLAGNAFDGATSFSGPELAQSDGQFEAATPVANYLSVWVGFEGTITTTGPCNDDGENEGACIAASPPNHPEIAALAGASSLLVTQRAFLRIARAPGASVVRFEARLLSGTLTALKVGTMALDAGKPAAVVYRDAALAPLEATPDSAVRSVTVPIPEGDGDVLMAIDGPDPYDDGDDALWLDSLRSE